MRLSGAFFYCERFFILRVYEEFMSKKYVMMTYTYLHDVKYIKFFNINFQNKKFFIRDCKS